MKVLLVVPALVLLQLVCPGSVRSVPINITTMLKEMYDMLSSNATIPGHLRNATVPRMENCDKKTFCEVQQVLHEFADNGKIERLCRSLDTYNKHTHKNCTNATLQMTEETVTFELQDLISSFIECIRKENLM